MRHTLRWTAPLAFGFFVLATSASAECAWVLWVLDERLGDDPKDRNWGAQTMRWIVLGAASSETECHRRLRDAIERVAHPDFPRLDADVMYKVTGDTVTPPAFPTPSTRVGRGGSERRHAGARCVSCGVGIDLERDLRRDISRSRTVRVQAALSDCLRQPANHPCLDFRSVNLIRRVQQISAKAKAHSQGQDHQGRALGSRDVDELRFPDDRHEQPPASSRSHG